ncbi:MAG: hypothetical protein AAF961_01895 [Planctomycetota bacterium]
MAPSLVRERLRLIEGAWPDRRESIICRLVLFKIAAERVAVAVAPSLAVPQFVVATQVDLLTGIGPW